MDTIKIYGWKTKERKRLEAAAILINAEFDDSFGDAEVKDVFWDYGGGIKWTTIVFGDQYQALDPLQHAKIVLGNFDEFGKVVGQVVSTRRKHMQLVNHIRYGG